MKFALIFVFAAGIALAGCFPSDEAEKVEAATSEVKSETTAAESEKTEATADAGKTTDAKAAEDKCEPGSNFERQCNTCTCPENGKMSEARCTLQLCP